MRGSGFFTSRMKKGSDRRAPMRISIAAALLALACFGCQDQQTSTPPPYLDPHSASIDQDSPYTLFDGSGGSLLLTEGWGFREGHGGPGDDGSFSWSVADEVKMLFRPPKPGEYDFYARVRPFLRPGGAGREPLPQTIELLLAGQPVASLALSAGWQSIRIPLPRFPNDRRLLELAIRFAYATSPKSIGEGQDDRELGVSFSEAAIVRRDVQDARGYVASLADRLRDDGVVLSALTPWVIPLPIGSRVVMNLDGVETGCENCLLTVSVEGPDGTLDPIWSGTADEAAHRDIAVTTSDAGFSELRISLDEGCAGCAPNSEVKLIAGSEFLRTTEKQQTSGRPHVFIYAIDTLRADALEPYGAAIGSSPKIAEFASDAVVYSNARAASAWTLPSTVSLLTGVHADRHQVTRGDMPFSEGQAKSLPRLLSKEGYQTVGISQSHVVSVDFGLAEPFDRFFLNDHLNSFALRSQRVRRFFLQWLRSERNSASPIFAYFHTVDPHAPYEPAGRFRKAAEENPGKLDREEYSPTVFRLHGHLENAAELRHLKALYDGEVLYADAEFGKFVDLLKYLNLYEDSVIVLVSDHGEEFGEHGGVDHGRTVYDEMLRVPLIIKYPGSLGAGTASEAPASTVDVAPTILRLAGRTAGDLELDGRILPPVSPSSAGGMVFAQLELGPGRTVGAVNYSVYIRDALKCIHSPSGRDQYGNKLPVWQAFDLSSDPKELSQADATPCAPLATAWASGRSPAAGALESSEASKKSLERLRSLGYIH